MKFIFFLAVVVTISCNFNNDENKIIESKYDSYYLHFLHLSFQDTSGNDLVKGIEYTRGQSNAGPVNPNLYTLKVVFPDGILFPLVDYRMSFNEGKLFAGAYTGVNINYDRLSFSISSYKKYYDSNGMEVKIPFAEKITFKLICPYVFGDDDEHEIVTWWELKTLDDVGELDCTLCCRVDLDGKVFNKINYMNTKNLSDATIIWNGK